MQQVRIPHLLRHALLLVVLPVSLAGGCVITTDDSDDDGAADDTGAGDGGGDASADGGGDASADGGGDGGGDDNSGGDGSDGGDASDGDGGGGAGDAPDEGTWVYTETGETTNSCAFLEDVSNGWGDFRITHDGDGAFTITPGDDTDPFPCTYGGGTFDCPERLVDEVTSGTSSLEVLVRVEGNVDSATEMSGSQFGTVDCEGADCAAAETLLMTTFPCSFEVPFTADKV